jgi:Domain of unknown function (DUF3883)
VTDKICIKRLSASDCTLFEAVFRKIGAGNQKSINLNADVLTGQLFPSLAAIAIGTNNEIAIAISIHGPGGKGAHKLSRKIIKNSTYKNWRLNGEFVSGPPDDPDRYDKIGPGDLAVMVFRGDAAPTSMDMILISRLDPTEARLHASLEDLFNSKSMVVATPVQIAAASVAAGVPNTHPVFLAASDSEADTALEQAAQGDLVGAGIILISKGKRISGHELAKAKAKAETTGQDGEGLVNGYLSRKLDSGMIKGFTWTSSDNAIAPYDFEVTEISNTRTLIDVKSTSGPFENVIHISLAEIIKAAGTDNYQIYRVFELDENGGKLRISGNLQGLAQSLKTIHETHIPPGVRVDGFSVAKSTITWGPEEYIERLDE